MRQSGITGWWRCCGIITFSARRIGESGWKCTWGCWTTVIRRTRGWPAEKKYTSFGARTIFKVIFISGPYLSDVFIWQFFCCAVCPMAYHEDTKIFFRFYMLCWIWFIVCFVCRYGSTKNLNVFSFNTKIRSSVVVCLSFVLFCCLSCGVARRHETLFRFYTKARTAL